MTKQSTLCVPGADAPAAEAGPAEAADSAVPFVTAPPEPVGALGLEGEAAHALSADAPYIPPESEAAVFALLDVYQRACRMLELDGGEEAVPRRVALTILNAALSGENDLDRLYALALKAAAN
jgi:hypothetical protein